MTRNYYGNESRYPDKELHRKLSHNWGSEIGSLKRETVVNFQVDLHKKNIGRRYKNSARHSFISSPVKWSRLLKIPGCVSTDTAINKLG